MTKEQEALKLALEALEAIDKLDLGLSEYATRNLTTLDAFVKSAATAVKEALAQDEQEHIGEAHLMQKDFTHCIWAEAVVPVGTKLYTAPPAAQPPLPVQPAPEIHYFCSRCGKRTPDLTTIHTCTPPEGGHQ